MPAELPDPVEQGDPRPPGGDSDDLGGRNGADGAAGGVDLARAALAEARARARERAGSRTGLRGGKPVPARPATRARGADPVPFGAAVDALLAERGWQVPAAVGGVLDRWAELVGPEIAGRATPEGFDDGVVRVRAASTAWATQLRLLAPDIVRRLNTELGHGTVTRLDIRGPAGPSWRRGPLRVSDGRGPRDTYG